MQASACSALHLGRHSRSSTRHVNRDGNLHIPRRALGIVLDLEANLCSHAARDGESVVARRRYFVRGVQDKQVWLRQHMIVGIILT